MCLMKKDNHLWCPPTRAYSLGDEHCSKDNRFQLASASLLLQMTFLSRLQGCGLSMSAFSQNYTRSYAFKTLKQV